MKWVLNTYQTCQDWDVPKIIEMCLATGHEGIEFLMDFKQAHGIEADASPAHVESVARQVRDAGLIVASVTSCVNFHSSDSRELKAALDQGRRVIDHAQRMGCDHVRVLGDRVPADPQARTKILDQVGDALGELAEYAAGAQIIVSLEVHGHFTDPELALHAVQRANRPNAGLVFNSQWRVGAQEGWSLPQGAGSIKPLYDLIGRYFTSVHTHKMENPDETGYYMELFRLLKEDGFTGFISNECAYRGPDPEKVLSLYTALFRAATAHS